jgi:hypothetical protein
MQLSEIILFSHAYIGGVYSEGCVHIKVKCNDSVLLRNTYFNRYCVCLIECKLILCS